MAKIASPKAELAVLRGLCSRDQKIAGTILGSIDESYFYSEESVEIYQAIMRYMGESGSNPSYKLLLEDPDISEDARSHMRQSQPTISTVEEAKKAVNNLNKYRQARGVFNMGMYIKERLEGSKIDTDTILQKLSTDIGNLRAKKTTEDSFVHFGKNNSSNKLVRDILFGDNQEQVIPTGFEAFDKQSGGFARGSLVTIGSVSGGGKCLVGDTQVRLVSGNTVTLKEVWDSVPDSEASLVVHDGPEEAFQKPIAYLVDTYQGPRVAQTVFKTQGPTIKITFEDGRVIEGLAEHKLMVRDDVYPYYKWSRLDELTEESDVLEPSDMHQLLNATKDTK